MIYGLRDQTSLHFPLSNTTYNIPFFNQVTYSIPNGPILPWHFPYVTPGRFELGDRLSVVRDSEKLLIIAHYESKNNKKFTLEQLFHSLNKLFTATVIQEFTFCQNFFCLEDDEIMVFFISIFKQSLDLVLDRLKGWVDHSKDIYALLIIYCLLIQSKEALLKRKFHALDHYIGKYYFIA